jgi:hypothetical protein
MAEKIIEVISNALTNEVIEIELSAERISEMEADRAIIVAEKESITSVRNSAFAKLAALGLTEEEIAAL